MGIEELDIDYFVSRKGESMACVRNFPGLSADMNEKQLRDMAKALLKAADSLEKN